MESLNPNPKSKQAQHPLLRANPDPILNPKPNVTLQSNELLEWTTHQGLKATDGLEFLYPTLNDPEFALNIAQRREFNDTKHDVVIPASQAQLEREAAKLC